MTRLVVVSLAALFAYAIYVASLNARRRSQPGDFLDAGGTLPGWSLIFAATGVVLAGLGLHDHMRLVARYGLPYGHVALGLVLVALAGALVQKRLWLAARMARIVSPVELLGAYYASITVRIFALVVVALFAVPFAAQALGQFGDIVEAATAAKIVRTQAIWAAAFFLFLFSVIGGWRGIVHVVAAQSFLVLVLVIFLGGVSVVAFDNLQLLAGSPGVAAGPASDKIPGVVQYVAGIGKDAATGGPWTTLAILSFALSLVGIVLNPCFGYLATTTTTRTGFAFHQVWMVAGLAGGLLLLLGPGMAAQMSALDPAAVAAGAPSIEPMVHRLAGIDQLAAICLLLVFLCVLQIAVAFFAGAGASIATSDIVVRFLLPDLTAGGRRLAARIAIAVIYAMVAAMATFAPLAATIFASVALSLAAQLLPAYLGLCWVPWISRSAVITGLIAGSLLVVFTEPPGLILFERLFVELPWGRWPLTVHSAAWGLAFNIGFCLLVSVVTRGGPERSHRDILHDAWRTHPPVRAGGALQTAKWSLALIWTFLALGPGAIVGNDFFAHPFAIEGTSALGMPSLLVWQLVFWFVGVLLVWWLAYQGRMSVIDAPAAHAIDLRPPLRPLEQSRVAGWIARLLARVSERAHRDARRR